MSLLEIIFISVGLAMDCFAVAIAGSIAYGRYDWLKILRMAFMFGLMQGLMPVIGWGLGISFADAIRSVDHWLAFAILSYLGGKMIYESWKERRSPDTDDASSARSPYTSFRALVVMSVATSIDALATGLIFVPLGNLIVQAAIVIFIGSLLFTILGCVIGVSFGKRFNVNVEAIGGVILIAIGTKILIEHLVTGC